MTRFAPRAWAMHLLVLAVAGTCVSLGVWQLDRHAQLRERNALLRARLDAAPMAYLDAAGAFDPDAPAGARLDPRYRPVRVGGRFAPEHEVLLRGRSLEGRPGYHVLTPLSLDVSDGDSRAVLVDRGWVPYRLDTPGDDIFAPPTGRVTLRGRLMPTEEPPTGPLAALTPRDPPEGPLDRIARPDVARLQSQMPFELDPFVIHLETETDADTDVGAVASDAAAEGGPSLPVRPPPPAPEGGPHLAYAAQWFLFALIAACGYAILLRRRGPAGG
ncbi:MAG: SURF1 family protein [Trueperaceae bacterium]|nr:SURF1 family protein [Trueperaceae bacterium]